MHHSESDVYYSSRHSPSDEACVLFLLNRITQYQRRIAMHHSESDVYFESL